uniref:Uncharacterized protein n=1 Tax=Megaselia scalaris TaxID=36166 RepID=T1GC96_MEGSC
MEILMDRNLEKSMSMNMDLYLNIMLMMREMMDKRKEGRGGMIINLLANLGLQDDLNLQQYLINKQMLLSLTESMAKDRRNEERGIRIMALMPNINKRNLLRNMDWMRGIGLQEFMLDLSWDRRSDDLWLNDREDDLLWRDDERRNRRLLDEDLLLKDDLRNQDLRKDERRRDQGRREDRRMDERRMDERRMDERRMDERRMDERRMDEKRWDERRGQKLDDMERRMDEDRLMRRDDWQRMQNRRMNEDLLLEEGQRLGGRDYLDGRRMLDRLALNMIRCIEMGENRMLLLINLSDMRAVIQGVHSEQMYS